MVLKYHCKLDKKSQNAIAEVYIPFVFLSTHALMKNYATFHLSNPIKTGWWWKYFSQHFKSQHQNEISCCDCCCILSCCCRSPETFWWVKSMIKKNCQLLSTLNVEEVTMHFNGQIRITPPLSIEKLLYNNLSHFFCISYSS